MKLNTTRKVMPTSLPLEMLESSNNYTKEVTAMTTMNETNISSTGCFLTENLQKKIKIACWTWKINKQP